MNYLSVLCTVFRSPQSLMETKKDVPKATRVAMLKIMGIEEIRKTFKTEKGAGKTAGAKTLDASVNKKIMGKQFVEFDRSCNLFHFI